MDVSITIYQQRIGRTIGWHVLGLPPTFHRTDYGRSVGKMQQRVVDRLRRQFRELDPGRLSELQLVVGRKLERMKLELTIRGAGTRRRIAGQFPVVVETHETGPITLAYHPLRQENKLPVDPEIPLVEQVAAFFSAEFAALDDLDVELLTSDGKESLRVVSFRFTPKKLIQSLDKPKEPGGVAAGARRRIPGRSLLAELGSNVTQRAVDDLLEPGTPRSPWREQLQHLMCGEDRTSVVLVGPAGVGKSTLVRRLVFDLLEADGWSTHHNIDRCHAVWQLRGRRIIAGMRYLGQWEERCVELLDETRAREGSKPSLLWVDDLHAWGHIGGTRESDRTLSIFFRGPLVRKELTIVGEATPEQWAQLEDDAPTFAQAFTTLHVTPTDAAETMRLLVGRGRKLELRHDVEIDPRAYRTLYELGGALFPGNSHPGKVLDLLDALVGVEKVQAANQVLFGLLRPPGRAGDELGAKAVISLLSRRTGMPERLLSPDRDLHPEDVERWFDDRVMGQEGAIKTARDLVLRIKTGLVDQNRPFGVYLFSGPTGTGKTELAKCLARYLYGDDARLVRLDMSEYNTPGSASRLIGDRWQPDGILTRQVRAQPFCVVLLDEIEKADPSVLNLMLQLFDDGRLTDASGEVADFRHAVVVMTSNLGTRNHDSIGFGSESEHGTRRDEHEVMLDIERAIREFFPPELFNRIDRVVPFRPLGKEIAFEIAERELHRLLRRRGLVERNVFVQCTRSVLTRTVERGFSSKDGARSLKRWIEDEIGGQLAIHLSRSPGAHMRQIWLYLGPEPHGPLRFHEEAMREALPTTTNTRFETMLSTGLDPLLREVPHAIERLRELEASGRVETLSRTIRAHLARFNRGEDREIEADAVFDLDAMRAAIAEMRRELELQLDFDPRLRGERDEAADRELEAEALEADRFATDTKVVVGHGHHGAVTKVRTIERRAIRPILPAGSREALLWRLGEAHFLARSLRNDSADPTAHVVFIELVPTGGAPVDDGERDGLLPWLLHGYACGRGVATEVAIALHGEVFSYSDFARALERIRESVPARVVLKVVGIAVREFFAGDEGSHVRDSSTGFSDVVRVRILRGSPDDRAADLIARQEEATRRFTSALEEGREPLPENPDVVLPIVRRFQFDPPRTEESLAVLEVEDYRTTWATSRRVRRLEDILPVLWILGLAHDDGERP